MSSLRNAVARPTHKERSQPASRQKWGLLEKHKDYSLRAADFNTKKRKLGELSRKARERNPDEFAFGMVNKAQGKHGRTDVEKNRLGHDAVKLLKTQDAGYLRVVTARNRRELEETERLVKGDLVRKTSQAKVVFDQDGEVLGKRRKGEPLEDLDNGVNAAAAERHPLVVADGLEEAATEATKQRSKKELATETRRQVDLKLEKRRRKRMQELRAAKLEVLKLRQKEIMAATDVLELQRAKMAKTVGGTNKDGVKWKIRERKR